MELFHPVKMITIVGSISLLIFLYFLAQISKSARRKGSEHRRQPPTVAGGWPIIGHLHLLGELPHITLGSMADKYGPIFTIKLGVHNVLVVSDSKLAKDCLTTNDKVFATRPKSIAVEVMGYNYAMFGLAQYGQYWREVRKIAMNELLSNHRLEMLQKVRVSEVKSSVKDLYEFWRRSSTGSLNMVKVEMKHWFGSLIQNYVVRLIAGKRYSPEEEEAVRFQKTVRRFFELLGGFMVSDAIPYLRWLDLGGQEKEMKTVAKHIDDILQGWLYEHKRKRYSSDRLGEQRDFMDAIISIVEGDSNKDGLPGFDPDTICKATSMTLLVAATDTTTVTLTWALSLLLNNPMAMKKAQDELDIHVGKERQVEESDVKNLVYLQAVVKETLRLYPAGPLSVPHESMEDCIVGGYHVPKGTRLLVNLWKIHRNDQVWSEPCEFRPRGS